MTSLQGSNEPLNSAGNTLIIEENVDIDSDCANDDFLDFRLAPKDITYTEQSPLKSNHCKRKYLAQQSNEFGGAAFDSSEYCETHNEPNDYQIVSSNLFKKQRP